MLFYLISTISLDHYSRRMHYNSQNTQIGDEDFLLFLRTLVAGSAANHVISIPGLRTFNFWALSKSLEMCPKRMEPLMYKTFLEAILKSLIIYSCVLNSSPIHSRGKNRSQCERRVTISLFCHREERRNWGLTPISIHCSKKEESMERLWRIRASVYIFAFFLGLFSPHAVGQPNKKRSQK